MARDRPVLVTGAAGFIGGFLAERLAAAGWQVTAIDVRPAPSLAAGVDFTQTSCAHRAVFDDIIGGRYDAVVHQAGISNTLESDWARLQEHNVAQPLRLADACAKSATAFIYASSFSVYGRSAEVAIRESDDQDTTSGPLNLYARSKLLLDREMRSRDLSRAAWAGLRYTNVFGPGEPLAGRASSIISQILYAAAASEPIEIFSDTLAASRDYVPASRIYEFVDSFLNESVDIPSGVYNMGSGIPVSFAELLHWATQFTGRRGVAVHLIPNPIPGKYQYWTQADNSAVARYVPSLGPMDRKEMRECALRCFEAYGRELTNLV